VRRYVFCDVLLATSLASRSSRSLVSRG
jgi:hypothetical protein